MGIDLKKASSRLFVAIFHFLCSVSLILTPGILSADAGTSDNDTVYLDSINRNTGTDCIFEKGPILTAPPDKHLITVGTCVNWTPIQKEILIKLAWNQFCSATSYELQISKDTGFTDLVTPEINGEPPIVSELGTILLVLDWDDCANPSAYIEEDALPRSKYPFYWRIRAIILDNGQFTRSPWSDPRSFTINTIVMIADCWGIVLYNPPNSSTGLSIDNVLFSWGPPSKNSTKYQFDLAKDHRFKYIVFTTPITSSTFSYCGKLKYNTKYFWRVKELEYNHQISRSPWTAAFSFTTEPPPLAPPPPTPADDTWTWIIAAISILLAVVIIVLITVRRKTLHR